MVCDLECRYHCPPYAHRARAATPVAGITPQCSSCGL